MRDIVIEVCSRKGEDGLRTWDDIRIHLNELLGKENHTPKTYQQIWKEHIEIINSPNTLDELKKAKYKIQDQNRIYNNKLKSESRFEALLEVVEEGLKKFEPIPLPTVTPRTGDNKGVVAINDWHCGAKFKNSLGHYDFEIMKSYVARYLENVKSNIELYDIGEVLILNLGDMIDGHIHVSTRIESEFNTAIQTINVAEVIAQFIKGIYETGVKIKFGCVLDNHSRIIGNFKDHLEDESFGVIIEHMVFLRLQGFDIDWVHNDIDPNIGHIYFANRNLSWVHGHLDTPKSVQDDLTKMIGVQVDEVFIGHRHHYMAMDGVTQCPAMVPPNGYAYNKRLASKYGQLMKIYTREQEITLATYF